MKFSVSYRDKNGHEKTREVTGINSEQVKAAFAKQGAEVITCDWIDEVSQQSGPEMQDLPMYGGNCTTVQCPHCNNQLTSTPQLAGQVVTCVHCQGQLQMPMPVATQQHPPVQQYSTGVVNQGSIQSPSSRRRRSSGTPKNPGVAIVLSFFFFGLGQLYNGQIGKGIFIMFLAFIFALLIWVVIGIFLLPVLYFWQLYDAYQSAEDYNRKHRF